ncbi:hypothetical protein [Shimia sp. SDUM112013]|uniref:hypothetical protein n=1 Tax=Shimia sp. SDUM112013 TaxID=3136160 RepID=UPI0032EFE4F9
MKSIFVLLLLAGPVWAEDWKMRDGDRLFSAEELLARLTASSLVFYDDGESVYGNEGAYTYTYGGGGRWEGWYDIHEGSVVCVTFVTGASRCDRIVENAGRLVLLTEAGERFPVRP